MCGVALAEARVLILPIIPMKSYTIELISRTGNLESYPFLDLTKANDFLTIYRGSGKYAGGNISSCGDILSGFGLMKNRNGKKARAILRKQLEQA